MLIVRASARICPSREFRMLSQQLHQPNKLARTHLHFINSRRRISDNSASSKLFADAEREEREESLAPESARYLERQHENWTGEESMEDAVLRMLVDKYKPLRSGTIRTADEKLKELAPRLNSTISLSPTLSDTISKQTDYSLKDQPLLPAVEGHKPWHTTFKAPSHTTPYIRYGNASAQPSTRSITEDKTGKKEKADKKRTQLAGRLTQAKESTLDYRLGLKNANRRGHVNPLTMKGWAGLVEERIERARQRGIFNVIKGRGQPVARHIDERNPFIDREEFLMNRIVKRNGAAPPFVELQRELDMAISTFRNVLRESWTRRAIRILTTENPAHLLSRLTLHEVARLRDSEWEERERTYHDAAIRGVNALVRKYNGLAPYTVRRPLYVLRAELDRVYGECTETVHDSVVNKATGHATGRRVSGSEEHDVISSDEPDRVWRPLRIRDVIREWLRTLVRRLSFRG